MNEDLPAPVVRRVRRGRFSLVWLVPVIAALAGGGLVARHFLHSGPTLHIRFETADGLAGGISEVRFRNVVVGKVTGIELDADRQHIIATVQLTHGASSLAVEDTKFWVERPRIGLSGVSGVETLISGAYVNVDVGSSTRAESNFVGLEKPPGVMSNEHGRLFKLIADDAGSLDVRSPVYFRRIEVGVVSSKQLSSDGRRIELEVFVYEPYDRNVTEHTVFWNASGIDLSLNANGLKLDTQSLSTVVAGGVAFGPRASFASDAPAPERQTFQLYEDRADAMRIPDGRSFVARMRFHESVRGLVPGTPVDFNGIAVGAVTNVSLEYEAGRHEFYGDVTAELFPERLGSAYRSLLAADPAHSDSPVAVWQGLIAHGLRAQMRSASLITGSPYIALAFFPHARPATVVPSSDALIVPTERGLSEQMENRLQSILTKVDELPWNDIGQGLRSVLARVLSLVGTLDVAVASIAPDARKLFADAETAMASLRDNVAAADAPLQQSARTMLEQVNRAAFSLRTLADYLNAHPESLIRGRGENKEPGK